MSAVYKAIAAVQGDLAREGIGKEKRNQQQGYNFRGIDDVYNALAPLLAKHGLCILPRCLARDQVERQSAKGGALFYTTVDVEFDFVASEDGSRHTVRVPGEAMDSADKSTNKAMSAAYKYAAMQAFCIPTEGDNDADATTHEVKPQPQRERPAPLTGPIKTRAELRTACGNFVRDLHGCSDGDMFDQVMRDNATLVAQVELEAPFFWNGDGADFKGLRKEIDETELRIANAANAGFPNAMEAG